MSSPSPKVEAVVFVVAKDTTSTPEPPTYFCPAAISVFNTTFPVLVLVITAFAAAV